MRNLHLHMHTLEIYYSLNPEIMKLHYSVVHLMYFHAEPTISDEG